MRSGKTGRQLDQPQGREKQKFLEQARLVRRYGAAVVVMAFDEYGQATSVEHRVQIADRIYKLLTEEVGFPPDRHLLRSEHPHGRRPALKSTTRMPSISSKPRGIIKQRYPLMKISGGVSNVSFSLRGNDTVREAMNSAFLYHAIQAGMDMGIVNPTQLAVYEEIDKELLDYVEDVLLNRRPDATERLVEFAETVKQKGKGRRRRRRMAARDRSKPGCRTPSSKGSSIISTRTPKKRGRNIPRRWRSSRDR